MGMLLGGEQELNTATKSGALNVAQQMLTQTVSASNGQFADVADQNGNISPQNVNMVYAKALMIALNAQDMESKGQANGSTMSNVRTIIDQANALCQQLQQQLNSSSTAQNYFNPAAQDNSVRMFGVNAQATASQQPNAWSTAYALSGTESNVTISLSQLPLSADIASLGLVNKQGSFFFPGYSSISAAGFNFSFVPYLYQGQPRLLASTIFNQSTTPPSADIAPVPNAWSVCGLEKGGTIDGAISMAYGLANPQQTFPFKMAGFIRIKLLPNTCTMIGEGEPCGEYEYGYGPEPTVLESDEFEIPECCLGMITAEVGLESEPGDLYSALFPYEMGATQTMAVIMQRVHEISPNTTTAQVAAMLAAQMCDGSTSQTFYLYTDNSGNLQCSSSPSNYPSFFSLSTAADGNPFIIAEQVFPFDAPNQAEVIAIPEGDCVGDGWAETNIISSNLMWTPGTGYNGFLGELSINRTCEITAEGFCEIIPIP